MPRSVASADRPAGGPAEVWGAGVRRVHSSGNVAVIEGDIFSLRGKSSARLPNDDDDSNEKNAGGSRGLSGDFRDRAPSAAEEDADEEDAAADARVGHQGSISFSEESLRFAAGRCTLNQVDP
jgi:hypothetical protein